MRKDKSLHWADQLAQRIIAQFPDKKIYTVAAGITPSGTIHIGNFREIITVDLIYRALKSQGKKARFIYSWDDYDRIRKVPKNVPNKEEFKKYMFIPGVDAPDPWGCHKSYTEHFEKELEDVLPKTGIKPEFIYQNKMYKKCKYADQIKFVLENKDKVRLILDKYRKEPLPEKWFPLSIYCDKCKREQTEVTDWNKKYTLKYKCECGFEGETNFKKQGNVKLLWRVDWPMRWKYEDVSAEGGGKEHNTKGGSIDTGHDLCRNVFKHTPPVRFMYDFITIKGSGGKMASSLGNVITLREVLEVYEPEMVRWLFAGTRPNTEFAISFDLDVLKIYEDFDKCERIYFGEQKAKNDKEKANQKRIYELSAVNKPPKKLPFQPSFRHLTNVLQFNNLDINKSISFYEKQLKDKFDKERLRKRAQCAVNWINKHAPEDFKFTLQEKVPKGIKLNKKQKNALKDVAKILKKKDNWEDKELHEEFYIIIKNNDLEIKDFFKAAYNVLINKDKGPKLAAFVIEIKDKAVKLFDSV